MPWSETSLHPIPPAPASSPEKFTYPFHYTPHPWAIAATRDLQDYLRGQTLWDYDFGVDRADVPGNWGKMFGVLVVRTEGGKTGYLAAFSGKVADASRWPGFVPPVYDVLDEAGFYRAGEAVTNGMNAAIERLETAPELQRARAALLRAEDDFARITEEARSAKKTAKRARDQRRQAAARLSAPEQTALKESLARQSMDQHFERKQTKEQWQKRIAVLREEVTALEAEITARKVERAEHSHALQHRIFSAYTFQNARGETSNLLDLFAVTAHRTPPAGAGECAAPKLLQYAYLNGYQPLALAEFWWGQSPRSTVRRHGLYYPACRGKCAPILAHMVVGLDVDPNPLAIPVGQEVEVPVIYEDDALLVVNKPAGMLSVIGRVLGDSVQQRMLERFPDAENHLIVHRLDMSTSGLLVLTKKKEAHEALQRQFLKREVKKRYVALLSGPVEQDRGRIDLPLSLNYYDRPRQQVDFEGGKPARTNWEVVGRTDHGPTRVHLWPLTGRTHQLRVHCAHLLGLNVPIVGDELYGVMGERLCLHAEEITFRHPTSGELVTFVVPAAF